MISFLFLVLLGTPRIFFFFPSSLNIHYVVDMSNDPNFLCIRQKAHNHLCMGKLTVSRGV